LCGGQRRAEDRVGFIVRREVPRVRKKRRAVRLTTSCFMFHKKYVLIFC
jgi:hypothetical protein